MVHSGVVAWLSRKLEFCIPVLLLRGMTIFGDGGECMCVCNYTPATASCYPQLNVRINYYYRNSTNFKQKKLHFFPHSTPGKLCNFFGNLVMIADPTSFRANPLEPRGEKSGPCLGLKFLGHGHLLR